MKVKVILLENLIKLGEKGKVVEVSRGYAFNYLIPKGLAQLANSVSLKELREKEESEKRREEHLKKEAEEIAERLRGKEVTIKAKIGSEGKLFGSITSKDISEAIKNDLGIEVEKKKILLEEPIKQAGSYPIPIKLFHQVETEVKLRVEEESG